MHPRVLDAAKNLHRLPPPSSGSPGPDISAVCQGAERLMPHLICHQMAEPDPVREEAERPVWSPDKGKCPEGQE